MHQKFFLKSIVLCCIITLTGCDIISDRLDEVGRVPQLSGMNFYEEQFHPIHERIEVESRLDDLGYENGYSYHENRGAHKTISSDHSNPNSIWRSGSRSFFKSRSVGDVLSVIVEIQDKAKLDNKTQKSRNSGNGIKAPSILGLENVVDKVLPGTSPASNMLNLNSTASASGNGKIDRKETVQTTIAATVVKILPSGNLIIKGSQEVRVNFDVREITVSGIVRPEDISSNNTVRLEQIAEARVSYGGRGHIFEYQQAPYGKQVLDIVSPL